MSLKKSVCGLHTVSSKVSSCLVLYTVDICFTSQTFPDLFRTQSNNTLQILGLDHSFRFDIVLTPVRQFLYYVQIVRWRTSGRTGGCLTTFRLQCLSSRYWY